MADFRNYQPSNPSVIFHKTASCVLTSGLTSYVERVNTHMTWKIWRNSCTKSRAICHGLKEKLLVMDSEKRTLKSMASYISSTITLFNSRTWDESCLLFERERPKLQNSIVCFVPKWNVTHNLRMSVNHEIFRITVASVNKKWQILASALPNIKQKSPISNDFALISLCLYWGHL